MRVVSSILFVISLIACTNQKPENVSEVKIPVSNEIIWSEKDQLFAARVVSGNYEHVFVLDLKTGISQVSEAYEKIFGLNWKKAKLEFFAKRGGRTIMLRDLKSISEWPEREGPQRETNSYWPGVYASEAPLFHLDKYFYEKQNDKELLVAQCGWKVCASINGTRIAAFEAMGVFGFPLKNMVDKALYGIDFEKGTQTLSHEQLATASKEYTYGVYEFANDFSGQATPFLFIHWPNVFAGAEENSVFLLGSELTYANPNLVRVLGFSSPYGSTKPQSNSVYIVIEPGAGDGCPGPRQWIQVAANGTFPKVEDIGKCDGDIKMSSRLREVRKDNRISFVRDFNLCMSGDCKKLTIGD